MRKFLPLALAVLVSACVGAGTDMNSVLKNNEVPTAFFVFFEPDSGEPTEGSAAVVRDVAFLLAHYSTLSARVIAHSGISEVSTKAGFPLDMQRSTYVVGELVGSGISASRLVVLNLGAKESMSALASGDVSVDRRVEIIMVAQSGPDVSP